MRNFQRAGISSGTVEKVCEARNFRTMSAVPLDGHTSLKISLPYCRRVGLPSTRQTWDHPDGSSSVTAQNGQIRPEPTLLLQALGSEGEGRGWVGAAPLPASEHQKRAERKRSALARFRDCIPPAC